MMLFLATKAVGAEIVAAHTGNDGDVELARTSSMTRWLLLRIMMASAMLEMMAAVSAMSVLAGA